MLLSPKQLRRFWSKKDGWPAIAAAHRWTPLDAEMQRKALLARAGFSSLTLVDPVAGFTRVLREMDALRDNLAGMLEHTDEANERRVLIHAIRELSRHFAPDWLKPSSFENHPYTRAIMENKFGHADPSNLSLKHLTDLRNTLAARLSAKRKPAPQPHHV